MGSEILLVFIVVPVGFWLFDLVCILGKRNTLKHACLLGMGVAFLTYQSLSTHLAGFHPMQGFTIGSIFYAPGYFLLSLLLGVVLRRRKVSDAT